jgi:hypothetical protein
MLRVSSSSSLQTSPKWIICYRVEGKPYLARYEKVPTTNKKTPYVILGFSLPSPVCILISFRTSTHAETTGSKKFSTQWGAPGNSVTFSFPLLFFRSWFKSMEQLSHFETQKALGTKIYKRSATLLLITLHLMAPSSADSSRIPPLPTSSSSPSAPISATRCTQQRSSLRRKLGEGVRRKATQSSVVPVCQYL